MILFGKKEKKSKHTNSPPTLAVVKDKTHRAFFERIVIKSVAHRAWGLHRRWKKQRWQQHTPRWGRRTPRGPYRPRDSAASRHVSVFRRSKAVHDKGWTGRMRERSELGRVRGARVLGRAALDSSCLGFRIKLRLLVAGSGLLERLRKPA